jgi:hypothetical protein
VQPPSALRPLRDPACHIRPGERVLIAVPLLIHRLAALGIFPSEDCSKNGPQLLRIDDPVGSPEHGGVNVLQECFR